MSAPQLQSLSMAVDDALLNRLREMTPPLDDETERQETLAVEAESRAALEADGCPPCYPPEMDLSKEPPPKYRQIVEYWKAFFGTDDVILRAQLEDWNKFRRIQARDRQSFAKSFDQFTAIVGSCLKSHGINEEFIPNINPEHQAPRDTWIEFLHYQLRRLEKMEKKRHDLQEFVSSAPEGSLHTTLGSDTIPNSAAMLNLESIQNQIEGHAILRQWIVETLPTLGPGPNKQNRPGMPRTQGAASRAQQLKKQSKSGGNNSLTSTKKRPEQKKPEQKTTVPKTTAPKTTARKTTSRKTTARKATPPKTAPAKTTPAKTAPAKTAANSAPRRTASAQAQRLKGKPAEDKKNTIPGISQQTANTTRKRKASHADIKIDVDTSRPAKRRAAKGASSPPASFQQTKAQSNANQSNSKPSSKGAMPDTKRSTFTTRIGRISRPPSRYMP